MPLGARAIKPARANGPARAGTGTSPVFPTKGRIRCGRLHRASPLGPVPDHSCVCLGRADDHTSVAGLPDRGGDPRPLRVLLLSGRRVAPTWPPASGTSCPGCPACRTPHRTAPGIEHGPGGRGRERCCSRWGRWRRSSEPVRRRCRPATGWVSLACIALASRGHSEAAGGPGHARAPLSLAARNNQRGGQRDRSTARRERPPGARPETLQAKGPEGRIAEGASPAPPLREAECGPPAEGGRGTTQTAAGARLLARTTAAIRSPARPAPPFVARAALVFRPPRDQRPARNEPAPGRRRRPD